MTNISLNWNLAQIFEEANLAEWICEEIDWDKEKEYTSEIIAWDKKEDERPIYIESIIAIFEQNNEYAVVHLSRKKGYTWSPKIFVDSNSHIGTMEFKTKPTQIQLIQYFKDTKWGFSTEKEWFTHDIGINKDAWFNITGENPPTYFLKEIERTKENNKDFEDFKKSKIIKHVKPDNRSWFDFVKRIFS